MQRGYKTIATFPNMDPAWFALVERRINDRKRWRRFAHDRMAVYVERAMQDAGAERTFLATDPSPKQ
jgi:hypothetical protein